MKTLLLAGLVSLFVLPTTPIHQVNAQEIDVSQFVEIERIGRGGIYDLAVSPDGRYLAVASESIWIYDLPTLDPVEILSPDASGIVAWSPDGHSLAIGADDAILLWDTGTWQQVASFEMENLQPLLSIAWSPDSRHIVFPGLSKYKQKET